MRFLCTDHHSTEEFSRIWWMSPDTSRDIIGYWRIGPTYWIGKLWFSQLNEERIFLRTLAKKISFDVRYDNYNNFVLISHRALTVGHDYLLRLCKKLCSLIDILSTRVTIVIQSIIFKKYTTCYGICLRTFDKYPVISLYSPKSILLLQTLLIVTTIVIYITYIVMHS